MANVRRHGGNCCSMSHIWAVGVLYQDSDPLVNERRYLAKFQELRKDCNRAFKNNRRRGWFRPGNGCHLIEIVTAQPHQGDARHGQTSQLRPVLEALGFREVSTVRNGNTGNDCTIFHLHMTEPFQT